ncbi:hypothetical protein RclHR1_01450013 [Rhizophagus clarus]|uniref:Uncharacterized protein n=1 Tax=Rhizophagus clarus TaxID=94130 RepID=A0A2Z6QEJ4_9GLOM|nr:hypothetical protein RclHR1_01450013 [Rhizophagus clarus]
MREYSFQIKKCNQPECHICMSIHLPEHVFNDIYFILDPQLSSNPEHFQDFNSLYGHATSKKTYQAPDDILVLSKVRDFIRCVNCGKLKCLFSQKMLKDDE